MRHILHALNRSPIILNMKFALGILVAVLLLSLQNQVSSYYFITYCYASISNPTYLDPTISRDEASDSYTYTREWHVFYDCSSGDESNCQVCVDSSTHRSPDGGMTYPNTPESSDDEVSDASDCGTPGNDFGVITTVSNMQPLSYYRITFGYGAATANGCPETLTIGKTVDYQTGP